MNAEFTLRARALSIVVCLFTGCQAATPPTHYYAAGNNWAIYLAWTEDATGHLQGQIQVVGADPNNPAKLRTLNGGFTGTRNGQDISISFPLLSNYLGQTWTGTLSNDTISLVIPTAGLPANPTLRAGSFQDFERATQKVQQQVNVAQQQQAAAAAAAQQKYEHNREVSAAYNDANESARHVKDGYAEVRDALAGLSASIPATPGPNALSVRYAQTYGKMQEVWQQEQRLGQSSSLTCYEKGQVEYLAGQVDYLRGQVQYLDGQTQYAANELQPMFNAANEGLDTIGKWAPQLFQNAQTYSQLSGKPNPISDPAKAVAAFRQQTEDSLAIYTRRLQHFQQIVKDYDSRALALQQQALAFPQSLQCSG